MHAMLEATSQHASAESRRPFVLLASRSPRRRSLLTEFGVAHDAEHPGFDDAVLEPGTIGPREWVASLAYLKAASKANTLTSSGEIPTAGRLVLGADTICVKHGSFIGTPTNASDARDILRLLSNGSHEVLTGVAMVHVTPSARHTREIFVDSAVVRVGELSDDAINEYVESSAWQGKAGGYNLAERLEAGWPIEYVGDPTTIMGLPMRELMPRLERMASRLGM